MTQERQAQQVNMLFKAMPVVISALSFLGGLILALITASFWFSKNVATVQYVDSKHEEVLKIVKDSIESLIKYADKVAVDAGNKAIDHSDSNKKDMMNAVTAQSSDIKALGAKQDILLDSVRTIQNRMFDIRTDTRKR